jgi:hypothetical protein
MWIFFGFNSAYLLVSFAKFWLVLMSLETFNIFEDNILQVWHDFKLYVWDPDQRLELTIEGYAELVKILFVVANYFIYW